MELTRAMRVRRRASGHSEVSNTCLHYGTTIRYLFDMAGRMPTAEQSAHGTPGQGMPAERLLEVTAALDDEMVEARLRAVEVQSRMLEAERACLIAVAEGRRLHSKDGHRHVNGWLRAGTDMRRSTAGRLRARGRLIAACPQVADALERGSINVDHVDEMVRAFSNPRIVGDVIERIDEAIDLAERWNADDFRDQLRQWVTIVDMDGAEMARERNHERRAGYVTELDSTLEVHFSGGTPTATAEVLAIFKSFVEREFTIDCAERDRLYGPDAPASKLPRTSAQRRFDALVAIFRAARVAGPDHAPPVPVTLNLLTSQHAFETILATEGFCAAPIDIAPDTIEHVRCTDSNGVVYAPTDVIRAAVLGHIRRAVYGSKNVITELGREQRLFRGGAREAVKLVSRHCEFPGCTVSAQHAEIDHLLEYARGGATDPDNGSVQCKAHNRMKNLGYRCRRRSDGVVDWRRPDGTLIQPIGRRWFDSSLPDAWINTIEPDEPDFDQAVFDREVAEFDAAMAHAPRR